MSGVKELVITAYGHDQTIDKIAVSAFDSPDNSGYRGNYSDAKTYCDTINSLELRGDSWVFAKIVSGNTQYSPDAFHPLSFDVVLMLDDKAIQKMLREVDSQDLARALKGAAESIKEKMFKNMSVRAAQMLKEDMECMGPVRTAAVMTCRREIVNIIRRLEAAGEIVIGYKGETIE